MHSKSVLADCVSGWSDRRFAQSPSPSPPGMPIIVLQSDAPFVDEFVRLFHQVTIGIDIGDERDADEAKFSTPSW